MKYEIQIGKAFEANSLVAVPEQRIEISEEQFEVIKTFANIRKDSKLNDVYILNDCQFRVVPKLDLSEALKRDW
jgi:hypothetical protein